MKKNTLFTLACILGSIGLLLLFSVILTNAAYPDFLFQAAVPLGLFFVFASALLGCISWVWYLKDALKNKEYLWAVILAAMGLFLLIREATRIMGTR